MKVELDIRSRHIDLPPVLEAVDPISEMGSPFIVRTEIADIPSPQGKVLVRGNKAELQGRVTLIAKVVTPHFGSLQITAETIDDEAFAEGTEIGETGSVDPQVERTWRSLWRAYSERYKGILLLLSSERVKGRRSMSGYEIAEALGHNPPKAITGMFSSDGFARRNNGNLRNDWKAYSQVNSNYSVTDENAHRFLRLHRDDV
jgi:hypothetical protein